MITKSKQIQNELIIYHVVMKKSCYKYEQKIRLRHAAGDKD